MSTKSKKTNQTLTTIKNAKVRYHADEKAWVVVDEDNNVLQRFQSGVMTGVKFSKGSTYVGCGSTYVGYATGNLTINKLGTVPKGQKARNFGMKSGEFINDAGEVLRGVNRLNLYTDRKSVYCVTA